MTWIDQLNNGKLQVTVETTTMCNAKCPQCQRSQSFYYNRDGKLHTNDVMPWIPKYHWDVERFSKYFTPDLIKKLRHINFSGDHSDPMMNPHILDILEYIHEVDKHMFISISTNGSMRDEMWWFNLGLLDFDEFLITFAIDGADQEMHERYRANTKLQKVLNNMRAFTKAGGEAESFTVLFKHNQDYLQEIIDMSKEYGATQHDWVESIRFKRGPKFEYIEKGEVKVLEQVVHKAQAAGARAIPDRNDTSSEIIEFKQKKFDGDQDRGRRIVIDHRSKFDNFDAVQCGWLDRKMMQIDSQGYVWPCCYWMCRQYKRDWEGHMDEDYYPGLAGKYVLENPKKLNMEHYTFEEILQNEWYMDILPNSWDTTPCMLCVRACGYKK